MMEQSTTGLATPPATPLKPGEMEAKKGPTGPPRTALQKHCDFFDRYYCVLQRL